VGQISIDPAKIPNTPSSDNSQHLMALGQQRYAPARIKFFAGRRLGEGVWAEEPDESISHVRICGEGAGKRAP